jgi:hypothetical protein
MKKIHQLTSEAHIHIFEHIHTYQLLHNKTLNKVKKINLKTAHGSIQKLAEQTMQITTKCGTQ